MRSTYFWQLERLRGPSNLSIYLGRFENIKDILRAADDHSLECWIYIKMEDTDCCKQYIGLGGMMRNVDM